MSRLVLEKGLPPLTCLNVNFPDTKELKGVKICEQTKAQYNWDSGQEGSGWTNDEVAALARELDMSLDDRI